MKSPSLTFLAVLTSLAVYGLDTNNLYNVKNATAKISSEERKFEDIQKFTIDLRKPITLQDIVSILATLATVGATILTYRLLRETKSTLTLQAQIAERDHKRLETETVNVIYRNFRDTYMAMCTDDDGIKILTRIHGTNDRVKENMFGSFLINNVFEIFNLKSKGFIDDELWAHFEIDINDFFSFPFIRDRWNMISKLYPPNFQEYVNRMIQETLTSN